MNGNLLAVLIAVAIVMIGFVLLTTMVNRRHFGSLPTGAFLVLAIVYFVVALLLAYVILGMFDIDAIEEIKRVLK